MSFHAVTMAAMVRFLQPSEVYDGAYAQDKSDDAQNGGQGNTNSGNSGSNSGSGGSGNDAY
jgi:hypothetical protein